MSKINKPMELSVEELDTVAGGALNIVDASNFNFSDTQAVLTNVGADGGISNAAVQQTEVSKQELQQVQATGELPGLPNIFASK